MTHYTREYGLEIRTDMDLSFLLKYGQEIKLLRTHEVLANEVWAYYKEHYPEQLPDSMVGFLSDGGFFTNL